MKPIMFMTAAALFAGTAIAQLPGVGAGAGVGAGLGAEVGAGVNQTLGGVNGTVRALDEDARRSAQAASDRATAAQSARVQAGVGVRAERGTRCYDTGGDFDPWYRDGYYYCERQGVGIALGAKAGIRR